MAHDPRDEFMELFLRHQRQVYAYVSSLLPYGDDADEVFQQTSLVLWKKWDQFRTEADFVRLACNVAYNEMRNYLRRKDAACPPLSEQVMDLVSQTQFKEQSRRRQRTAALSECLGELKPEQRTLIERAYANDGQAAEMAAELGVSTASLYMKLHRIRKRLGNCIDRVTAREQA